MSKRPTTPKTAPPDEAHHPNSSIAHGGVAARTFETVIFDAEGDVLRIEADQAAVGYCHPVRVARQIGQHSFWSGEGFLSIDDPVDLAQGFEKSVEGIPINKARMFTEELQLRGFVQLGQALQNETAIQTGQSADGQEEVLAGADPFWTIRREATAHCPAGDCKAICREGGTIIWTWALSWFARQTTAG